MYKFLCHIVAILVPARLVMTNRNWKRKAEVGITPILSSDISWSNQSMHRSTSNRYRINVLYFSNLGKYNCYIALNKYINVLYRIPDRTSQTSQYPVCDPKTFFSCFGLQTRYLTMTWLSSHPDHAFRKSLPNNTDNNAYIAVEAL